MGDVTTASPITLGELIDALAALPSDRVIVFDFGGFVPTGVDSYRGYYQDLAVAFKGEGPWPAAATVLHMLRGAVGREFTGYKGGEFRMDRDTRVWAANYGRSTQTAITGVTDAGWVAVINTAWSDS